MPSDSAIKVYRQVRDEALIGVDASTLRSWEATFVEAERLLEATVLPQASFRQPGVLDDGQAVLMYINGIRNSVLDSRIALQRLGDLVVAAESRGGLGWELGSYTFDRINNPTGGFVADLVESAANIAGVLGELTDGPFTAVSSSAAQKLNSTHEDLRRQTILVAHSQGNLIALEALRGVRRPECVGIVSIASPLNIGWPSQLQTPSSGITASFNVGEDIITVAPSWTRTLPSGFDLLRTPLAESVFSKWVIQAVFPPLAAKNLLSGRIDVHSMTDHYLDRSRGDVAELLRRIDLIDRAVQQSCGRIEVVGGYDASLEVGASTRMSFLHQSPTSSRAIDDVDVSPAGIVGIRQIGSLDRIEVTGVAPGEANIVVRSGPVSAAFRVTVTAGGGSSGLGVGFGDEQFSLIPAGSFQMGSTSGQSSEQPVRTVTISRPYFIQRTEVTQAQWRQVMAGTTLANPSSFASCGDSCPVERVSWNDIQTFLARLNQQDPGKDFRLPTEAEWEYAARSGSRDDYGIAGDPCRFAWTSDCGALASRAVGLGVSNAYGLHDMHGNVGELVNDRYSASYYSTGASIDPRGPRTGSSRSVRGGSFARPASDARSSARDAQGQSSPSGSVGFRLARGVAQTPRPDEETTGRYCLDGESFGIVRTSCMWVSVSVERDAGGDSHVTVEMKNLQGSDPQDDMYASLLVDVILSTEAIADEVVSVGSLPSAQSLRGSVGLVLGSTLASGVSRVSPTHSGLYVQAGLTELGVNSPIGTVGCVNAPFRAGVFRTCDGSGYDGSVVVTFTYPGEIPPFLVGWRGSHAFRSSGPFVYGLVCVPDGAYRSPPGATGGGTCRFIPE